MDIIEIAHQIELKKKSVNDSRKQNLSQLAWKPMQAEQYTLPEFNIPSGTYKTSTEKTLSKVLAFVDMNKQRRFRQGCTIMPIATTEKRLLSITGSRMESSRLIKYMCRMGLIELENGEYQFNAFYKADNHSRLYRYYVDNEIKLKQYCMEHKITMYICKNTKQPRSKQYDVHTFDKSQVVFSSKLHLLRPPELSVSQFEAYLLMCLYENYPMLRHYQMLADEINKNYYQDNPDFAIRFVPNFTWSKGYKAVKKIGIRATNHCVSASCKEKEASLEDYQGLFKEDILRAYMLDLFKDVKSSVPRITLSLNAGKWVSENIDIYEDIYNIYVSNKEECIYGTICNNFKDARQAIKDLHMRAYFDSDARLGQHTRMKMLYVDDKEAVDKEMQMFKQAIIQAEGGKLYDSEIFYHESCIYLDVLYELLKSGYFVWECYDAFYARKAGVTQADFEQFAVDLVEDAANVYIANWKGYHPIAGP